MLPSVVYGSEAKIDDESYGGSESEFLNTHKTMLGKCEHVCELNSKLAQESAQLKFSRSCVEPWWMKKVEWLAWSER